MDERIEVEDSEDDLLMGLEDTDFSGEGQSTVVGLVLDRSGSMGPIWAEALNGYNLQLQELREQERGEDDEILVVSTVFDNKIDVLEKGTPVEDVEDLKRAKVQPRGMTALYDAIGTTLSEMQTVDHKHKDRAYLLVVITDGEENSSQEYGRDDLAKQIKDLEATKEWTVVFLGSDMKSVEDAKGLGFDAMSFGKSSKDYDGMSVGLRSATSCYYTDRTKGTKVAASFTKTVAGGDDA